MRQEVGDPYFLLIWIQGRYLLSPKREPRQYKAPEQFLVPLKSLPEDQITLLEKLQAASNPKQDENFSKVYVTDTYFPHYNQHKKIISPSCSSDDALHFLSRSDSGTGVHPGRRFLPPQSTLHFLWPYCQLAPWAGVLRSLSHCLFTSCLCLLPNLSPRPVCLPWFFAHSPASPFLQTSSFTEWFSN